MSKTISLLFVRVVMRATFALVLLLANNSASLAAPTGESVSMPAEAAAVAVANNRIFAAVEASSIPSPGRVVVVYFTPNGRQPAANHTARIRRIAEETARFYNEELRWHGFESRAMNVLRNEQGEVDIIDVVGHDADYDKPDGGRIRNEVLPVLRRRGIDPNASVLLLFCNLMNYDPVASTISHHSPYYGGGNHLSGTAWQCDSEILDPERFRDATPIRDGQYGWITIGRHNSIFIGGVVHELGHALSLPHCRQRKVEAARGTSLMGSGNHTYRQELRGEGLGTFLTQAHAFRLAAHPVFNRRAPKTLYDRPVVSYQSLRMSVGQLDSIQIKGCVSGEVPIFAMIAYFDPDGHSDYDATTAAAVPDEEGRFVMHSQSLKPNTGGEVRLVACHVNGATSTRKVPYSVDEHGRPDLAAARLRLELARMLDVLRTGDVAAAEQKLAVLAEHDAELQAIGRRVLDRFTSRSKPASIDPSDVPQQTRSIALSELRPVSVSVGWLGPTYDKVPSQERLLSVGGEVYASGIYAHAPAEHVYQLEGDWRRLTGKCGVQDAHPGRVQFELLGDGRSLWSARRVAAGVGESFDIDISGVETLRLSVTDSGDGTGGDWGVWIEPTLSR